ncbi:unnamed protein product [Acanthoscelides obtectus]|uniref:Uncharacterized protein n=1 Tax=Acanthoscelides obtectus TaxID=200917 RepID=A0A9P0L989_ACAOB|nr:unnamed protein product [Acanthoscelides obtectus]CAK1649094.1 hypothetical protein AOBTE_LOCUS16037 [Acanthoscelides obtectus]
MDYNAFQELLTLVKPLI